MSSRAALFLVIFIFSSLPAACHFSQRFPLFPHFSHAHPAAFCLALLLYLLVYSTWHCSVGWLAAVKPPFPVAHAPLFFFFTIFWTGREFVFHAFQFFAFPPYLCCFDFTLPSVSAYVSVSVSVCLCVCVEWHLTKLWHTRRCGQNAGIDADDDDDDDEGGAGGGSEICQENERMSGRIFLLPAIDPYDRRRLSYQMYGRCVDQFQEIFFLGSWVLQIPLKYLALKHLQSRKFDTFWFIYF